ncbi:MAG: exodeoxyribonuclease VII large subunit [Campylobacteraceae bacterium]|nr:exodeoxyribonuclease VII large subunit [Campylobacteraceae bacterium]
MILSVSELNEKAKALLEINFANIEVKGEISRLTKNQSSGHWYFTLKDRGGAISCAMFRFNNSKVKFEVEDGMEVIISGKVSIYSPSGSYQLIASNLRVEGVGDLELAFKQLKERLEKEGLFDGERKKPLPAFPKKVAIITSVTSAAYQDMLRVAKDRNDMCSLYVYNALMQGDSAANSIITALKKADTVGYDAIVIARGGGSKEDLWCFNDESLARAIFEAKTPVISAIGHEIDFSISDFVSDHRSLTPTAAMVDLLPEKIAFMQYLDMKDSELRGLMEAKFNAFENRLSHLKLLFKNGAIGKKIELNLANLNHLKRIFESELKSKFAKFESNLKLIEAVLNEKNHFYKVTKGLVQISKDGRVVSLESLKSGDEIRVSSQSASKQAVIK